jgi:geranylgeranyl pyrophosphate synthase
MDAYESIIDHLSGSSIVQGWPEMKNLLVKASSRKPRAWQLPIVACRAAGGRSEQAIPEAASIACLQISIILIDDMLDGDSRGVHHQTGAPAAANLACAFIAAGLDAITLTGSDPKIKFAVFCILNRMILTTAFGQNLDVEGPVDEEGYWRLVRAKSSPFFGAALQIGALVGGASAEVASQIERFGHVYGEMIQIQDDLNDAMASLVTPDWLPGRSSLPILYAETVDHPAKDRFIELRKNIPSPEALAEAQTILIRCGAVSYCIDQLLRRHRAAKRILEAITLPHPVELEGLLVGIRKPVAELFASTGLKIPPDFLEKLFGAYSEPGMGS